MLKKSSAFIMADSVLALMVITLGVASMATCQFQLQLKQQQHVEKMMAARLAKEASDAYRIHGQRAAVERKGYCAAAQGDQVVVSRRGQVILRVAR